MKIIFWTLALFIYSCLGIYAQNDSILEIVKIDSSRAKNYVVSPSLSATLIGKGQIEVNSFNILDTRKIENRRIIIQGDTTFSQSHLTRFEQTLQVQFGLDKDNRFNLGFDVYASHSRGDSDLDGSVWRVFGNQNTTGASRHGFSALAPRIRWTPFESLPEFSVQGSAVFGLGNDTTRLAFGRERTQLLAQFVFYQRFVQRFYLFASADVSVFLKNNRLNRINTFNFPVFLFGSYNLIGIGPDYPKLFANASLSYVPKFIDTAAKDGWQREGYDSYAGIGFLGQINPHFGLTLWGSKPLFYNLDQVNTRVLPGSWYTIALGLRYLWSPR